MRAPPRETALQRWAALARARREQMAAQLTAVGGPPDDWWSRRAASFTRGIGDPAAEPPFGLRDIGDRLGRADTLIDVGAGAGRYAVPLARTLRHVTLVEPSAAMAEHARTAFAAAGLDNYTLVEREWPSFQRKDVPRATAVLIANVLSPVEDLRAFIEPALARASDWLFIVHGTVPDGGDAVARVIEAFHGEARVPLAELGDLIPALHELGVYPHVLMGTRRSRPAYADLDEAARVAAANALVEPTPAALRRIRGLLRGLLRPTDDGRLAAPPRDLPVGLLVWRVRR